MKKIILLIFLAAAAYGIYLLYQKPGNSQLLTPRPVDYINFPIKKNPAGYFRTIKTVVFSLPADPVKKNNTELIKSSIESALKDDIDLKLIVFGEASLGSYIGGNKYMRGIAETIPGNFTNMLAGYTVRYNIYIAAGLIEAKDGKLYNSFIVVNPEGKIEAVHRKMLLSSIDESNGISKAGFNFQVADVDGFRCGIAIGDEINDRKLWEEYQKENLDAVINPSSADIPWISRWLDYWPYGKIYNSWIISPGRWGVEGEQIYNGTIFICSPDGYLNYSDKQGYNKLVGLIGK